MNKTPEEIMDNAFKKALLIAERNAGYKHDDGAISYQLRAGMLIAASNLAIALFSYEAEHALLGDIENEGGESEGLLFDDDTP